MCHLCADVPMYHYYTGAGTRFQKIATEQQYIINLIDNTQPSIYTVSLAQSLGTDVTVDTVSLAQSLGTDVTVDTVFLAQSLGTDVTY